MAQRSEYYKQWRVKNLDYVKAYDKERATPHRARTNRLRKYNLTVSEYDVMLTKQDSKCAICGKHQSELAKSLCVDHNHTTGKVRALLCSDCNTSLGLMKEDPELLNRAIEYLKEHK